VQAANSHSVVTLFRCDRLEFGAMLLVMCQWNLHQCDTMMFLLCISLL